MLEILTAAINNLIHNTKSILVFFTDVERLLESYGYIGMLVIAFLETALIFPLPGDSLVLGGGMLAGSGTFNIYIIIFLFFLGNFLGSIAGYFIGANLEKLKHAPFISKYASFIFSEKHLQETEEYMKRRGEITVLFCRFVPMLRTFAPMVAGVGRMPFGKFVLYNFVGAISWAVSLSYAGYVFGRKFPEIINYMVVGFALVLLLTTLPTMFKIYKKYKNK